MTARRARTHPATGYLLEQLTGARASSIPALLRGRTAATPEAPFLRWQGRVWSYADALDESERVAGFLREAGAAGASRRVASYLPNCPEALWAWFGSLLAGAVYVPLNRTHRGPILRDMLARSGATVLVTDGEGIAEFDAFDDSPVQVLIVADGVAPPLRGLEVVAFEEVRTRAPWSGVTPSPYDLGTVMYTSGSTGRSKAVLISHNQQPRSGALIAEAFGLGSTDVWHGWPPVYHVMGQLYAVIASIAAGGSVALQPGFSRSRFWEQVTESGATVIGGLASAMRLLWTLPDDALSGDNPVRLALVSGAFGDLHRDFERRFGLQIADCFGMTEAEPMTLPVLDRTEPGSHGLESPDFEVEIVDHEDLLVAAGTVGEIVARPRCPGVLFSGYEDDDEQTVRSWRSLWFHTGDLGFLDDEGFLHFLDRRKHGIRRRGENISTWELETLLHTAPGVSLAVAVGIEVAPGEEDIKIVVIPEPASGLSEPDLHGWCVANLARFMVPRYIELRSELPELTLGKVDRSRLTHTHPDVWDASSTGKAAG